jgi:hypothetical protein
MSSDDAYMSFLDKANADLDAGRASQPSSTVRTQTVHTAVKVPAPLQSVDAYYVSETDEPFEPVTLKWDGAANGTWPSAGTFFVVVLASCLGSSSSQGDTIFSSPLIA